MLVLQFRVLLVVYCEFCSMYEAVCVLFKIGN
jgi:hypothetical protein